MFEKFSFKEIQVINYYKSAIKDFGIADKSDIPEVTFKFSYDAMLKLAIALCAKNQFRVKSRQGHHVELINKLSEFLSDDEIRVIGNEMRMKRNIDLYSGGTLITKKEAREYVGWIKSVFKKSRTFFNVESHKY